MKIFNRPFSYVFERLIHLHLCLQLSFFSITLFLVIVQKELNKYIYEQIFKRRNVFNYFSLGLNYVLNRLIIWIVYLSITLVSRGPTVM